MLKIIRRPAFLVLYLALAGASVFAQTTAFSYQGHLNEAGSPVTGTRYFRFTLYDENGAAIPGASVEQTLTVTNGIFNAALNFGASTLPGANRSLEIAVKINTGDAYTVLSPRADILSAPYAVKSKSADTATTATQLNGLDSTRFVQYDANGDVGIGTMSSGSKLTVAGIIESTAGGVKFPDATVQTTAGLTAVTTDATLTGNGTTKSPLGIISPLNIRDQDNPAFQPVQATAVIPLFGSNMVRILTVPSGKRLVIETISGFSFVNAGGKFLFVTVVTTGGTNGGELSHYFAQTYTGTTNNTDYYSFNNAVRIYANPQTDVTLKINTTTSIVSMTVTISGYYQQFSV